jgi:hypothetical protein
MIILKMLSSKFLAYPKHHIFFNILKVFLFEAATKFKKYVISWKYLFA